MVRDRLLGTSLLVGVWAVGPVALLHFLGSTEVHVPGTVHIVAVGAAAAAAFAAALALTVAGVRRRDGRVVLLATGFSAMAATLMVHGLATPGFLVGDNGIVALTGALTLPLGGAILALSVLSPFGRPRRLAPLIWLQAITAAAIVGVCAVGMAIPSAVPSVPEPRSAAAFALLVVGVAFYGALLLRAARTYVLTRRLADLAVASGIVWLAVALVAALTMDYWQLGWWMGHGLEIAGIAVIGGVIAYDLYRAAQSRPLLGDFRAAELVAAEEAFLGSQVHALMLRLAEKDEHTEGHTRRVAMLAVAVGEELDLPRSRLRALALGGLLHDIGKLSIPDSILKKPSSLTEEEFDVIRLHTERGERLLGQLGGFSPLVQRLVGGHHERLDGSGYPQGLTTDELELEVRIIAVCDVYDALTSPRVYREAWTHDAAMQLVAREAGEKLDARCVEALERVVGPAETQAARPARAAPATGSGGMGAPLAPNVAAAVAYDPPSFPPPPLP